MNKIINKISIGLICRFLIPISLILIFYRIIIIIYKIINNNIKICVCTIGKNENLYILEFIEYYKSLKVDKIFLYDNNDINGEKFEDKIGDYIRQGFVKILNWRGKLTIQTKTINHCYKKNYKNYNWFLIFDLDEYLFINKEQNLKKFLNNKRFLNCQLIYFNELIHTDNDKLYYENDSLKRRFPKTLKTYNHSAIKYIVRGNISNIYLGLHIGNRKLNNCDGFGGKMKRKKGKDDIYALQPDYSNYYLDHYYSKSTEEFIKKINRGDACSNSIRKKMRRIKKYYNQNNFTRKKIEMIENGTKLDLSEYKIILGYIKKN